MVSFSPSSVAVILDLVAPTPFRLYWRSSHFVFLLHDETF